MERYNLKNRRYLWNKTKLLDFIFEVIKEENIEFSSICDIFAWTGVVWNYFNDKNVKVIANDILFSNFVSLKTFLNTTQLNYKKIPWYINYLNSISSKKENYVSQNFWDKYFDMKNAIKIWAIRDEIENMNLSDIEKSILISSLIYAADKVANTCWHYAAYRKTMSKYQDILLLEPNIEFENNSNNIVYQEDANYLAKKISADLVYLDPPYNSRQYFNSYHVLENIAKREKPELEWITRQIKNRNDYKSDYCTNKAYDTFKDLIDNLNCKYIIVSYNNTWEKLDARSNSKLSDEQITEILSIKWKLTLHEKEYKFFTTWKNNSIKWHKERLFVCKVK